MVKSTSELGSDDLVQAGLPINEAKDFELVLTQTISATNATAGELWPQIVAQRLLNHHTHISCTNWFTTPSMPIGMYPAKTLLSTAFLLYISLDRHTNLGRLMEAHGSQLLGTSYKDPITSFGLFQKFSVQNPEAYWSILLKELSISFREAPKGILDRTEKLKHGGLWLPNSVLNIAECCLLPTPDIQGKRITVLLLYGEMNPVMNLLLII